MYGVINYIILIIALLVYFKNRKIRLIYWGLLLILTLINTVGIYKSIDNVQFQAKFTHGENYFVVKEIKSDTNFSLVYSKRHKIFIYLIDKISIKNDYKPFSNNKYKVLWINNEKALIKYEYGSNTEAKGHILNFTKINAPYSNVLGNLEGTWADKNNKGNTITFDREQITYKAGSEIYWYSSSMADEQGNYGSVLYGANNTPAIYILINSDSTITIGYIDLKNDTKNIYGKK